MNIERRAREHLVSEDHHPTSHHGRAPQLDIDALLKDTGTRVIVCCGSGGVGKTTTAAALGLRAAEQGRKVVVLTIDPARRLAQSMGLTELDNTPREVQGVDPAGGGKLDAMMLDMKRTFDEIVLAHADAERAQQVLANPFYQSLSSSFSGTQEYMAMEKLGQLRKQERWDLIVVDTPPSRSALDFLDAPKRLGSFLDGRFIRIIMAPAKGGARIGARVMSLGMGVVTTVFDRVLGGELLRDVQTFVNALDTMFGGFRERADETYRLLKHPETSFLVVAAPERDALREASYFVERLSEEKMPLAGLVLNRVHDSDAEALSAEHSLVASEALGDDPENSLTAGLLRLHAERMATIARERRMTERFTSAHPGVRVGEITAQPGDVNDLEALRIVGETLAQAR